MDLIGAFLDVLALIGIILTAGFLVFFIGDLVLSILDPNYGSIFKKKNKSKETNSNTVDNSKQTVKMVEPEKKEDLSFLGIAGEVKTEEKKEEVPFEKVKDEKIELNDFEKLNSVDDDEAEKEAALLGATFAGDDAFSDLRAEEEKFKQDKLKEAQDEHDKANDLFVEDEDDNDFSGFNFDEKDDSIEELLKDIEEDKGNDEVIPESLEEEVKEATPVVIEDNKKLLDEIKALKEELEKAKKSAPSVMSKDECEEKLNVLRDRLKASEKEFKGVKKEYMPLHKIKKNLDKDKAKLRRKEAVVAKQKVMLYGVNNIVEIDQEKAKKLSEELDLLDGLRLSVAHCEDVLNQNKDRYPLLEKTFNILKDEIEDTKLDIQNLEEVLKNLSEEPNGTDAE